MDNNVYVSLCVCLFIEKLATPVIPSNSVGMLLTGLCSCLPEGININEAITLINEGELPASR